MTQVEWHPYPDEKPFHEGKFLITLPTKYEDEDTIVIASWYGERWIKPSLRQPIAWAELPEPYHPDGEDDESSD